MIAAWMVYAFLVTALLCVGGALFERLAVVQRWPVRWAWVTALVAAVLLVVAAPFRPHPATAKRDAVSPRASAAVELNSPVGTMATARGATPFEDIRDGARALVARAALLDRPLQILWGGSALLVLLVYGAASLTLARRRRHWRLATVDGVEVSVAHREGPALVGAFRPTIVLPEWALQLDARSRELMLRHELEHLRVRDPLLLHLASVTLVLMPWNLPLWWLLRRLQTAVELDCDARVLGASAPPGAANAPDAPLYGELLLTVARQRSPRYLRVAPAFLEHTSSLSRRISAMYPRTLRFPLIQSGLAALGAAVLLLLAAFTPAPALMAQEPSVARVFGSPNASPAPVISRDGTKALLNRYFPDVLRGEGPATVVFVRDPSGKVIGTASTLELEQSLKAARRPIEIAEPAMSEDEARARRVRGEAVMTYRRPDGEVVTGRMLERQQVEEMVHRDVELREKMVRGEEMRVGEVREKLERAKEEMDKAQRDFVDKAPGSSGASISRGVRTENRAEDEVRAERAKVEARARELGNQDFADKASREVEGRMVELRARVEELKKAERVRDGVMMDEREMRDKERMKAEMVGNGIISVDMVVHRAGEFGARPVTVYFLTRKAGKDL